MSPNHQGQVRFLYEFIHRVLREERVKGGTATHECSQGGAMGSGALGFGITPTSPVQKGSSVLSTVLKLALETPQRAPSPIVVPNFKVGMLFLS